MWWMDTRVDFTIDWKDNELIYFFVGGSPEIDWYEVLSFDIDEIHCCNSMTARDNRSHFLQLQCWASTFTMYLSPTMNFINVNAEDFISICFRRSTYEEIYQSIIFPVNGEVLWKRNPNVHPSHKRILLGRPKKN